MAKDLVQLGFRLELDLRSWFVNECDNHEVSAATVLVAYLKKCRETGTIDPLGTLANTNVNEAVSGNGHIVSDAVNDTVNTFIGKQETVNTSVSIAINRLQTELEQLKQSVNNTVNKDVSNYVNDTANSRRESLDLREDENDQPVTLNVLTSTHPKQTRLTEEQKSQISALFRGTNHTIKSLAKQFRVNESTVSRTLKKRLELEHYERLLEQKKQVKT